MPYCFEVCWLCWCAEGFVLFNGGCEREAFRPPSWWSTTNQSGEMPHTRGLLATLEIFARRVHYFKEVWSAAIGTRLAISGL
jgi:hypothetical protein